MARRSNKTLSERMLSGDRVGRAVETLGISAEKFIQTYDELPVEQRHSKVAELEARLAEREAELARLRGESQAAA